MPSIRLFPFTVLSLYFLTNALIVQGQMPVFEDYVGAGNSQGITVTTSSDFSQPDWNRHAIGLRTIDGGGLDANRMEASRFLTQAGFGGTMEEIEALSATNDFEGWIDWQASLPRTNIMSLTTQIRNLAFDFHLQNGGNPNDPFLYIRHFHYAWWQAALTKNDVFRQRMAQALSEIFVISIESKIRAESTSFAAYYDMLMRNSIGNFRTLLKDVTFSPAMGVYLSHFRNPKTDSETNTFPDENFSRELLQLFSIGLAQLNADGTPVINAQGNEIQTYSPEDIRELAKIFTGLGAGNITAEAASSGLTTSFLIYRNNLDFLTPMVMYDDFHEPGSRSFLGQPISSDLNGTQQINAVLDIIFNHPNVGPFISTRLIQQLVKSNPSSLYVADVAAVFNNNGNGVRGDLLAVGKAILLHEEARDCLWQNDPGHGKLRSPQNRFTHYAKAVKKISPDNNYWTAGYHLQNSMDHLSLSSPSVFNFYQPDHIPQGDMNTMNLKGPEFQIHNSSTSLGYVNQVDDWTRNGKIFSPVERPETVRLDKMHYGALARDPEVLLNHLDILFTAGRLSEQNRQHIRTAMLGLNNPAFNLTQRAELAMYLVMISPEYVILK